MALRLFHARRLTAVAQQQRSADQVADQPLGLQLGCVEIARSAPRAGGRQHVDKWLVVVQAPQVAGHGAYERLGEDTPRFEVTATLSDEQGTGRLRVPCEGLPLLVC
jgi:hypothetical protein